jgi:Ser/Thr protein kinase RdoA (MazF antagonist)
LRMVPLLVGLQVQWADRVDELLGMGLPDWRHPSLTVMVEQAIARTAAQLDVETVAKVVDLTAGLDDRFAAVARCGIPDSLVHGDFHPGNVRGGDERLVLLDWGDCGVGHPLLDQAAFVERLSPTGRTAVQSLWSQLWRDAVPGCDPDQAAQLLEPVAALRQAVIYDVFLAAIEPDERVYHAADPAAWLRRAAKTSNRV